MVRTVTRSSARLPTRNWSTRRPARGFPNSSTGYTLEEAALMADTIKQWDKPGIDDPKVQRYFSSHPKIAEQLRAFWKANPPTTDEKSAVPSHHWFHYTDVPLVDDEKYADGKAGRSQWDIVHMMRYRIEVLQGKSRRKTSARSRNPSPLFCSPISSATSISRCTSARSISMRRGIRRTPTG